MAGIPEHVIDQVHDRIDIVEVIGSYIPLKKSGRNYKAPCPFHHEKTPSFMVSQDKQIFHCFGCGAGGNVFNFLMKYERLEFPEAVRTLAQRAGVLIPERDGESAQEASLANSLYAVNELASDLFQKTLNEDRVGRQAYSYLIKRGLTEEMIKQFRLGFAPAGWDTLLNLARQKGIPPKDLEKAGLVIAKDNGGYYDRFRNRIMFTIFDVKGRILGFGGRVFLKDDNGPKYMNSPETVIYNKGRNLYGLNFTWKYIRDEDRVIIVEGYLDLICPFLYGIKNIVASLGTSLTQDHIRLLKRYTKNAVVIFDPDKAGELATLRTLDLLLEEDLNVSVVRLPEGLDPDSFVGKFGLDEFKKTVSEAKNLFDYKMSVLTLKYDRSTLENRARIVEEMLPTIARVQNAVLKSGYIKSLAQALLIEEDAIKQELKKVKLNYPSGQSNEADNSKERAQVRPDAGAAAMRQAEKILTGILIDDNSCIETVRQELRIEEFHNPAVRRIVEVLFKCREESRAVTPGKLINYLGGGDIDKLIPELVDSIDAIVDRQKTLKDCILRIKQENLRERRNRIQVEIALAQNKYDDERINRLIAEYQELTKTITANEVRQ